jgi:hypothetical protein
VLLAVVPFHVLLELTDPEICFTFRQRGVAAIRMTMTETAMGEKDAPMHGQHEKRLPRQVRLVQSETAANMVKSLVTFSYGEELRTRTAAMLRLRKAEFEACRGPR